MTAITQAPEDVLTHLIVILLTPMFLSTTGGDVAFARAAAAHTVSAYTARNPIDLILIAQTIVLGLAVLSSVGLSMTEGLPITLILRLRGNAASLHRAAETSRRAMAEPPPETATPAPRCGDLSPQQEAAMVTEVARTQERAAAWQASLVQPTAAPIASVEPAHLDDPPTMKAAMAAIEADAKQRIAQADVVLKSTGAAIPRAAPSQVPPAGNERYRSAWCSAMADVAAEITAELATLPAAERHTARAQVDALNKTANGLISAANPSLR